MASSGIFFFTLIAVWVAAGNAKNPFIKVECNTENIGEHGHQSLLECAVKTTKEVVGAVIRVVTWTKEGVDDPLLVFNRGELRREPGYRFAEPSWDENNMNISLLIARTAVADDGDYTCMVITDSGDDNILTRLKVKATYRDPTIRSIPEKISEDADNDLICNADGGYPKGQLRWFDENNVEWTRSAEMDVRQTDNGLFQLSSKLTLLKGSRFSKYTCVVFNATGGKGGSTTFEIPPTSRGQGQDIEGTGLSSKIAAPVIVIGSLIVGLLLALLIYRRRSQMARRPSAAPLMGDQQRGRAVEFDAEKGRLQNMESEQCEDSQP
uniref:Ig-like domain-containing protein n=1 Tax=Amphiprion percula TaxID=161767 RepID=A0A3P8RKW6_AMPPE